MITRDELVEYLAVRFGHNDFWTLPREFKQVYYEQTANLLLDSLGYPEMVDMKAETEALGRALKRKR